MKILLQIFEKILKIHCDNLEKLFKLCKYQKHLIQQYLNELILQKLKKQLRKFCKILLQKF